VLDIIGNTLPILLDEEHIFVKAEFLEPGGSITTVLPERAECYSGTTLM
jgi:hypothetical protein